MIPSSRCIAAAATLLLGAAPQSAPAAPETPEEIVQCVASNAPSGDEFREVGMTSRDRAGNERDTRARIFARRTAEGERRLLVRMVEPAELAGSSVLISEVAAETQIYLYSPELREPRRVTGVDPDEGVLGTDLTYDDLFHLQGVLVAEAERLTRLADDSIADRPVFVLENRPLDPNPYDRVLFSIDRERCVVLQATFYAPEKSQPRKIVSASRVERSVDDKIWIPHLLSIDDLADGTRTNVYVRSAHANLKVPDVAFSPEDLGKYKPNVEVEPGKIPKIEFEPVKLVLSEQ